ncbi:annexin D7-like [Iris pallida]|uniref:Annexin D7-like n=1 Tax=Iris pallida TaxID=29817 RepID=A0AAX6HRR1_IRIPA|nr:annexin D7-like [Iris pallida]
METKVQLARKYGADCFHLHSYFSGTDHAGDPSKVIATVSHRNTEELKLVRQAYCALYNQDILHLLSQKNSLFARVVYLRVSEPHERDAEIVRGALFGSSLDLDTLTEVICTRPSAGLRIVREAYRSRYMSDLDEDVSFKINGSSLKEVLLAVLKSCRYAGARVEAGMAMCDAKTLYEAIESGKHVDQRSIVSILGQRSTDQMKAILCSYRELYGHDFLKFLKKDKCGAFGKQLRVVVRCIQSPEKQLAKRLRRALMNSDAREALIRIVVTRSEIDIERINGAFTAKSRWSLDGVIRNEFNNNSTSHTERDYNLVGDVLVALLKHY